ncbi:pyridoxal-phosphate dependent enzyme, partial [Pontiella sp.]|uniref:pyridoxal-phosphate dependent enzyme n=1 Tax=Pontiella sp. TaxID=2837462 RepID=UPI003564D8EC
MNRLFSDFPSANVSTLPTPIVPLAKIGAMYGHANLFMKQDNLSGTPYGGNKIRKLDFLLGEALAEGRKSVITYGAAGSNHALATAICCRSLGLKAISILAPQKTNAHVRQNLLMQQAVG